MKKNELPLDSYGQPFSKPSFFLDFKEYKKIISEINDIFEVKYKGKRICAHPSFGIDGKVYIYWFENHGFDNYNIFLRVIDNH